MCWSVCVCSGSGDPLAPALQARWGPRVGQPAPLGAPSLRFPGSLLGLTDFLSREACGADPPLCSPPPAAPPSTAGRGSDLALPPGFCPASAGRFSHNQGGTSDQLLWLRCLRTGPRVYGSEPGLARSWLAAPRGLGKPGWDLGTAPRLCQVSAVGTPVLGTVDVAAWLPALPGSLGVCPGVAPSLCQTLQTRPSAAMPRCPCQPLNPSW